jgi:DNA-binding MurR/RpiR family transcriptional regulator
MLAEAGSHGATTVALTSFPRSPLAELSDIVLLTATQATTFRPDALSARHPQLVVLDLLYIAVAQRTHDRAHAAFQRTAQAVDGHKAAKEAAR